MKLLKFNNSINFENDRHFVSLLWKDESQCKLIDNFHQTKARFERFKSKLDLQQELKTKYHQNIKTMKDMGIIEEVFEVQSSNNIFHFNTCCNYV